MTDSIAGDELRAIVERIELTAAEKQDAADAQKEIYAEAKGRGYSVAVIRQVVARRKRDRDDLAEADAVLEIYETAIKGNN